MQTTLVDKNCRCKTQIKAADNSDLIDLFIILSTLIEIIDHKESMVIQNELLVISSDQSVTTNGGNCQLLHHSGNTSINPISSIKWTINQINTIASKSY